MNKRMETLQALREDPGFIFFIERVIEPTDEEQRNQIRLVLKEAAQERLELRRSMVDEHRQLFSEMRAELDKILTAEQKQRLRTWVEKEMSRGGADRRPPPFMRGRRDGFPPDSARFPRRLRPRRQAPVDSLSTNP